MNLIRNFSIIAHIDHGKSTLADRLLELSGSVEKRKLREQMLDTMELERERGITIKMTPVTLTYNLKPNTYNLNLIDTPGHIDFAYEVSRALKAVEGVILLVDATQGVQAQTLSVLGLAREFGLKIIPVVNKIDLPAARVAEATAELAQLLGVQSSEILAVSGRTGAGVPALLAAIVERIPPPLAPSKVEGVRALVFDSAYSEHQGVVVYVRVFDGRIAPGDELIFGVAGEKFKVMETGIFTPERRARPGLETGQIGYLVTGLKDPGRPKVGETILNPRAPLALFAGYEEPKPVVWASIYPEAQNDWLALRRALERLRLTDAALSFEEETSTILGRGFRAGFLGLLHLEIITERLRREFGLALQVATPTIGYWLIEPPTGGQPGERRLVASPHLFPAETKGLQILEPWVAARIIVPENYVGAVVKLFNDHEVNLLLTDNFGSGRMVMEVEMPLRELMRNFFDELKSVSSGFASFSYRPAALRPADVARLDILVNGELVPAFSRVVARRRVERAANEAVDKLVKLLPRQLIAIKIQAQALGRIIAARSLSALRKDVTDYLYGGDITRKMKLREKQKKGKKKMQARGAVNIPSAVFLKMIRSAE